MWRAGAASIVLALLVAGCGNSEPSQSTTTTGLQIDDANLRVVAATWVNQLGLNQDDPSLWRDRLARACNDGVWNDEVSFSLATEFLADDAGTSVRAPGAPPPTIGQAAQALWLMAIQVCRESFPPEAIDAGPPGL